MTKKLKTLFDGNLNEYKSIPFWSWNNHLDEKELVKQIEEMYAAGIGGFIMHARTGLKDEYLGEKWFSCIEACLDKAKALGMEAWIYDENGWPSGFVGGKLLEVESYRARFLEYAVGEWEDAYAVFIEDEKAGYKRVEAPVDGVKSYHKVYLRVSPANSDILNPEVVDEFIRQTHEEYYARYADRFGKELVGFFTDEPQYYRWATAYTPWADPIFAADGEDIRDGLIWLFLHDERGYAFRAKYYQTLNELYVNNFYKKLYDWCESHGCKLTGHSVEEGHLFTQMWGGAAVAPSYEFEHIPGIDALGRDCVREMACKEVASVCAQLGKKQILTETYGCSGNDVTPRELKSIGQSQYFQGVNKMCQHLYPYSISGQGKVDHPPVFGPHSNWLEGFKSFNDYFTRLGALVVNTEECVDVAILHPVKDVWLEYVRKEDFESVKEIERAIEALLQDLRKHGVTFHFINEQILRRHGKVEGDGLVVGKRRYDTLLIPKMKNISATSYRLLQQYTGKLCVLQAPEYIDGKKATVELHSSCTLEDIKKNAEVAYRCEDGNTVLTHRKGEVGEFLFLCNLSLTEGSSVAMKGAAKAYRALDLESLQTRPISDELTLSKGEGMILIKATGEKALPTTTERVAITDRFAVTGISPNYLVMDYAQIAREGENFGERYPIVGLFEALLREDYKGEVRVRQTFTLAEQLPLKLIMEDAKLKWATLNGKPIAFTQNKMDVYFVEAEIGEYCKAGENEFVYAFDFWQHEGVHFALFDPLATESLRNCLYYDTSVETTYLEGDFTVDADMVLSKRTQYPALSAQLYKEGYPFFKGELTAKGNVCWDGVGKVTLGVKGRYQQVGLKINGRDDFFALTEEKDITSLLCKGENEMEITLRSSLRNLFGPHHFAPAPEPMGVSPFNFTMRGCWGEGKPSAFTDEYFSVPFGADEIYFILEK